jgi:hypothetical protein
MEYRKPLYTVNIDFDEASAAWKANKKPTQNGCYKYVCQQTTKAGKLCSFEALAGCDYCKKHNKMRKIDK